MTDAHLASLARAYFRAWASTHPGVHAGPSELGARWDALMEGLKRDAAGATMSWGDGAPEALPSIHEDVVRLCRCGAPRRARLLPLRPLPREGLGGPAGRGGPVPAGEGEDRVSDFDKRHLVGTLTLLAIGALFWGIAGKWTAALGPLVCAGMLGLMWVSARWFP